MSNAAIHWAWQQRTGDPTMKLILQVLADLADEAHSCFPSLEHIADKTETSESTVKRRLRELEAAGMIRRERRDRGFGNRASNRYVLDVDGQISAALTRSGGQLRSVEQVGKPLVRTQEVNLTPSVAGNETTLARGEGKPLVSAQEVNLTPSMATGSTQEVNCDLYIETPHYGGGLGGGLNNQPPTNRVGDSRANESGTEKRPSHREVNVAAVDRELEELVPGLGLTFEAIEREVAGRVDLSEVDVVRAVRETVVRAITAGRRVDHPATYAALVIVRSPEKFGHEASFVAPVSAAVIPEELSPRERELEARLACRRGDHDWGPEVWGEVSRSACIRRGCAVRRRDVDPVFRELEDEHDRFSHGREVTG